MQLDFPEDMDKTGRSDSIELVPVDELREEYEQDPNFIGDYAEYHAQHPESVPLDFEMLQDIFSGLTKRVGLDEEHSPVTMFGAERMFYVQDTETDFNQAGATLANASIDNLKFLCDQEGHLIGARLHKEQFEAGGDIKAAEITPEQVEVLRTLWIYIHEQIHAVSGCQYKKSQGIQAGGLSTGFSRVVTDGFGPLTPSRGRHLEEGMTDYLTQEVLVEYLRRSGGVAGVNATSAKRYIELSNNKKERKEVLNFEQLSYSREVRLVKLLIAGLATVLDTDELEIKQSFIRAKLRSGTIFSAELRAYFKQAGLADIYQQIEYFDKEKHGRSETSEEKDDRFNRVAQALVQIIPPDCFSELSTGWETA